MQESDSSTDSFYFPQELVNTTIDLLQEDPTSLRNCALVAKSWTRPCRQHLFKQIEIKISIARDDAQLYHERMKLLLQTLSQTPYLPPYIRQATLKASDVDDPMDDDLPKTMALVFDQLTSLELLHLNIGTWPAHPPDLKLAIRALIAQPSLKRLCFDFTTISPAELRLVLSGLSNVALLDIGPDLQLSTTKFNSSIGGLAPTSLPSFHNLKTLIISSSFFLQFLLSWLNTSHVSRLSLEVLELQFFPLAPSPVPAIQHLVDLSSSSLAKLVIPIPAGLLMRIPSNTGVSEPALMLNGALRLREIQFDQLILSVNPSGMRWILSILSAVTAPLLKAIRLGVVYYDPRFDARDGRPPPDLDTFDWTQWGALDDLLSKPQYRDLEDLSIFLSVEVAQSAHATEMQKVVMQRLRSHLPRLQDKLKFYRVIHSTS